MKIKKKPKWLLEREIQETKDEMEARRSSLVYCDIVLKPHLQLLYKLLRETTHI